MENTDFTKFYDGSYYTVIGCGGNIEDWKNGYTKLLREARIGEPEIFYTFKGKEYNDYYELTGDNRYPDDLTFMVFPLDGLNVGKLSMFKIKAGDRWFDDVVNNDLSREAR